MDWSRLPPLAALRAFEAAARHRSFSAAARELNVTHAAVAQQVRGLESHLQTALVFREGRGLGLTAEAEALAAGLSSGFGQVAEAVAATLDVRAEQPLRVSVTPSLASKWLMPRLGDFWARHPDIPISLHPDRRVVDLRLGGMDVAIRYGSGAWPGHSSEPFMPVRKAVVAAPSALGGKTRLTVDEMKSMPWVLERNWPEQDAWLREIGLEPDALNAQRVENDDLAQAAARHGYGLHVEIEAISADDITRGTLVEVFRETAAASRCYYIVTLPGAPNPRLRRFIRWLKSHGRTSE